MGQSPRCAKGHQVNIPEPGCGNFSGNTTEPGDVGGSPGKSSLFFLTVYYPEIRLAGARVK